MKIAVIGAGVFGTCSALELQRRGHEVTLFERGRVPQIDASSTDISKAIRVEYGTACPLYAPMAERAMERWQAIEKEASVRLLHRPGILMLASRFDESRLEWQSWRYLNDRGYRIEILDPTEAKKRWPQFNYEGIAVAYYNSWGGFLEAAKAVETVTNLARAAGVRLVEWVKVSGFSEVNGQVRVWVRVEGEIYDAALVAVGPWVAELLPELKSEVQISKQQLTYYRPSNVNDFREEAFPVWSYDLVEEGWYGFPITPEGILKLSKHRYGYPVHPDVERDVDDAFVSESNAFVRQALPALDPSSYSHGKVCLYTNSRNGDFIIDRAPGYNRLYVAGAGSGHAFKFGPVLGELAADIIEGREVPAAFSLAAERVGQVV